MRICAFVELELRTPDCALPHPTPHIMSSIVTLSTLAAAQTTTTLRLRQPDATTEEVPPSQAGSLAGDSDSVVAAAAAATAGADTFDPLPGEVNARKCATLPALVAPQRSTLNLCRSL